MILRPGRVRTGGSVWSREIVTVMQAPRVTARTSRKLANLSYIGMMVLNTPVKLTSNMPAEIRTTNLLPTIKLNLRMFVRLVVQ